MSKSREVANRNAETLDSKDSTDFAYDDMTNVGTLPASVRSQLKGDTGNTGATGSQGATGSTGSQGPAGNNGATGSQGPAGNNGATGSQGPAGSNGAQGSTGPAGSTGATGAQGPAGTVALDSGSTGSWSTSFNINVGARGGSATGSWSFSSRIGNSSGFRTATLRFSSLGQNDSRFTWQDINVEEFRFLVGSHWYYISPGIKPDGNVSTADLGGAYGTIYWINKDWYYSIPTWGKQITQCYIRLRNTSQNTMGNTSASPSGTIQLL